VPINDISSEYQRSVHVAGFSAGSFQAEAVSDPESMADWSIV
jgi:hypothetical protein